MMVTTGEIDGVSNKGSLEHGSDRNLKWRRCDICLEKRETGVEDAADFCA